ncbi:enoyl-CoA hydratase/isomerase [Colletotrichum higginsianum]|uniref:Enoyl-CoA hydratase/isomerase n=2 Tax=Colletotrichum higginsianum TaxID=80884 RepID=H1W055_COLHI|nr:Enoyl-CoA hydratase/isomerase [Colletotrichum higginsianum IMI 349063]OBR09968.1 Enoyl-CoA hydratase/isomerase [Colletotrichum higginsianum IMI 349063]TID07523.1 3-hydroxypropionyl-coenzyme A dehydratase [Colletotrichum higginsianum]GJD03005.1 enoyl-CoA hydratase/isomerase [Colletotrichum higginsianum]CCF45867.1 enoyl-CoA hydratase/isomerase [Colletotrichum higginsianum]
MSTLPESYNTLALPQIRLSHHPSSSPTPTPVIVLTLDRSSARNAFTDTMASSLARAYALVSSDPRVKCVVLTGSDQANRTFCAGMDLHQPVRLPRARDDHRDTGGLVALAMHNCAKPVVAAINGSAVGVGITMTLPASIRVVSKDAKIGFVFGRRGFNMEACSSFYLPRLIGAGPALHLVTTGAVYPANSPLLRNLFSEVVEPEQVLPRALAIAEDIAANVSTVAVRVMRDMIMRSPQSPEDAHLLESKIFFDLFSGKDSREGMESFMQKRAPHFTGTMEKDAPSAYPWWEEKGVKAKI